MSVKKYKFVSPGVFISEIDNSQLPNISDQEGPVIIGRADYGPALRPVKVNSFSEFVSVFGGPKTTSNKTDAWRSGDMTAPLYSVYAAQAWLKNNSPLTYVRLLGEASPDKTSGGEAGWKTTNLLTSGSGGAYGLFVFPSGDLIGNDAATATQLTGSLAAVWYMNKGIIALSGVLAGQTGSAQFGTSSVGTLIKSVGDKGFTAEILSDSGASLEKVTFSLQRTSDKFIRNVFNTSPTNTNESLTTNGKDYFLGQTFERHYAESFARNGVNVDSESTAFGVILPLKTSDAASDYADKRRDYQSAQTGWYIGQDLVTRAAQTNIADYTAVATYDSTAQQKLFKLHALGQGHWDSRNLKVSITNIKASNNNFNPFGTFTVQLRKIEDNDSAIQIVEQFDNCSLNPDDRNYIAKVVGDKHRTWDATERRWIEQGDFDNQSKYIRVEMNNDVNNKTTDERFLPFGVFGPLKWNSIQFVNTGSAAVGYDYRTVDARGNVTAGEVRLPQNATNTIVAMKPGFVTDVNGTLIGISGTLDLGVGAGGNQKVTGTINFPQVYPRVSSSAGNTSSPSNAYFGADTSRGAGGYTIYDDSTQDVLYAKPVGTDNFALSTLTSYSWVFTLDDVTAQGGTVTDAAGDIAPNANWVSGSRNAGNSITGLTGTYQSVLDAGFDSFTTVFDGGFDGLNILEKEPFNNTRALPTSANQFNSYAYHSVKKAIDSVRDAEVLSYNIASIPGVTNASLQDELISVCEDRGDALAVIDLPKVYLPAVDAGTSGANRYGNSPTQAISDLKSRNLNSSYACAYYPWVQIQDTINNSTLWAPPSIAAIGTFSSSQSKTKLWFAPAGFNRGGLSGGSAGIPVIGVREKLTSKQRDQLYDANINPIASFPAEGIVIFGQKTLQLTPSALDRINVRRLMIFVKKQISRMANDILFDQNVQATWKRFLARANPFLDGIKSDFGLTEFRVVLDDTTTTPELVDRNILYAKIFLKPARAIEYIAIDFNISNTGAAFED